MGVKSHLHASVSHVEKVADFLVPRPPIFLLTSRGTIHGGVAFIAVPDMGTRRCYGVAHDAAARGHDC
jgi:hypothetical protein